MAANGHLNSAIRAKNDEFYTRFADVERELNHYAPHFANQIVLCNCDDPKRSNFFRYFALNFDRLRLKRLFSSHFDPIQPAYLTCLDHNLTINAWGEVNLSGLAYQFLEHNGDFRSPKCVELLKSADIVVTNPPFSLFREYVNLLMRYEKKFLILGNQNAMSYKEIFQFIKEDRIWLGCNWGNMAFQVPDQAEQGGFAPLHSTQKKNPRFWRGVTGQRWQSFGNICWFTNLDHPNRHKNLVLKQDYSPEKYPVYDNYDAIEVGRVQDIPKDYQGFMGVPITFLQHYNPDQFEIVGQTHSGDVSPEVERLRTDPKHKHRARINGRAKYARILIRRRG